MWSLRQSGAIECVPQAVLALALAEEVFKFVMCWVAFHG